MKQYLFHRFYACKDTKKSEYGKDNEGFFALMSGDSPL